VSGGVQHRDGGVHRCGPAGGSYLRLTDCVYHSLLGLRVMNKKRRCTYSTDRGRAPAWSRRWLVFKAHRLVVSLNSRLESNKEEEKVYIQHRDGGVHRRGPAGARAVRTQCRCEDRIGTGPPLARTAVRMCKVTRVILHGVVSPERRALPRTPS